MRKNNVIPQIDLPFLFAFFFSFFLARKGGKGRRGCLEIKRPFSSKTESRSTVLNFGLARRVERYFYKI